MNKRELLILLSIVTFDLFTKLTANYYLPFEEYVRIIDSVNLYLTYNQAATGGQANVLIGGENNKNLTIILFCISGLSFLSYILYIRKRKLKTIYKVLIGVFLYLGLSVSIELVRPYFSDFLISNWTTSVIGKLTGVTVYGTLYYLSKDKWIRLSAFVIFAAGIGNLLSHFYLPYRVIDFIDIYGTYDLLRIGVFNFSDLGIHIGEIGLLFSVILYLYRRVRADRSKSIKRQAFK